MAAKRDIEAEKRQLAAAIADARSRLESQSTAAVRQVRQNAERKAVAELIEACDAELAVRGDRDFTAEQATAALEVARELGEAPLEDRIHAAFAAVPPSEHERAFVQVLASHPGATFAHIHKAYPHSDTAKVAGSLVHDRFGWFRTLPGGETERAEALIVKSPKGKQVAWTLSDAAQNAFAKLGLIDAAA